VKDDPAILAPGARYRTEAQIENGLRVVIRNGGSISAAAREMGIAVTTVKSWLDPDRGRRERFEQLKREMGPELEAQAVAGLQAFIVRAEHAKRGALEAVIVDIDNGDVKDPAKTLKDVAIAQGIGVQKILELTNRPTAIVEHRTPEEAYARLRALGAVIEGTADTLEPAKALPAPTEPEAK
jgi:hypothetical protein